MAYLLGQLSLEVSVQEGLHCVRSAAELATSAYPQPAFTWATILLGLFPGIIIPEGVLRSYVPFGSTPPREGKQYMELAASYDYGPALYQIGQLYEYSGPFYNKNAMRSLQYYQRASKHGIADAYMGMSRWFLCGQQGPGGFQEDYVKARKCAVRAANARIPLAEFAMGYYDEVGIGGPVDLESSRRWYTLVRKPR